MSFDWHLERISWSFHKFTAHSTALEWGWWRRFWSERTSGRSDSTNKRNQEETSRHKNFVGFQKDCCQNDFGFRKNCNCFSNLLLIGRSMSEKRLVWSRNIPSNDLFTHCMAWKTACPRAHSSAIRWYFQTWQKFASSKTYWASLSRYSEKIDHWIWRRGNLQYRQSDGCLVGWASLISDPHRLFVLLLLGFQKTPKCNISPCNCQRDAFAYDQTRKSA